MAEPTTFAEATMQWYGEGDVGPLPAFRDAEVSISKWAFSAEEIAEILETGVVWLHVYGSGHPPVYLSAHYPFESAEEAIDA